MSKIKKFSNIVSAKIISESTETEKGQAAVEALIKKMGYNSIEELKREKTLISKLENLKLIDLVIESNSNNALKNISLIKPNFYFKGTEYKDKKDITNNIKLEKKYVKRFVLKIIFTECQVYSSSKIINEK